ncbi:hypothetical protein DL89DRAFT_270266 [Linderina pennispora]|uniref:F-box domain-containing protein n=1 Tax=Linderina pennispora TaxID=61395 RepID=A0A1Y1VZ91_9FUNG|nr:uncharacterized protein DL89DRAFT_270266 [Linderina pennispora]ORX66345.1 hypothetical protein DL89DRAFT_270266 [Linderina pennispora]
MTRYSLNDMPVTVLHSVLAFLCQDIFHEHALLDDYYKAMDIATVCRLWGALMPSFVYHYIFVERKIVSSYSWLCDRVIEKVVWFSNVSSIQYQHKSHLATGLRVVMNDDYIGPLQLPRALNTFRLTSPLWTGFRALQFFGRGILRSGTDIRTPDMMADAAGFCDFMQFNYRSLESIILHPTILSLRSDVSDTFGALATPQSFNYTISPRYSLLLRLYVQSLSSLQCYFPVSVTLHEPITVNLATLELDLDSFRRLEHITIPDTATLETINLINIPGDIPLIGFQSQHTVLPAFPNLRVLQLGFKKMLDPPEQNPMQLGRFIRTYPKLSKLAIKQSTGVYQDLYSSFRDAPLRLLQINENHRTLAHISTEIIRNIDCLHLETIRPGEGHWWDDPADFVTRFYLAESTVRRAALGLAVPFPTNINWHDLVCLSLSTDMATVTRIVHLLEQLPVLKYLRITCMTMDPHDPDAYYWGTNDRQADIRTATELTVVDSVRLDDPPNTRGIEPINHNLQVLAIFTPGYFDGESLSKLPLFLPLLQMLAVDDEYVDAVRRNVGKINLGVLVCPIDYSFQYFVIK